MTGTAGEFGCVDGYKDFAPDGAATRRATVAPKENEGGSQAQAEARGKRVTVGKLLVATNGHLEIKIIHSKNPI
jgi:hypothetical protein